MTTTAPPAPAPTPPIRTIPPSGPPIVRFYRTAVGKKWVMAITGVVLMLFVLVHLIGNIKLYLSKQEINLYGEALRDMPGHLLPRTWLLWTIRAGLIVSFVFHIHAAYGLTIINRKARPDRYQSKRDYVAADFASRTMRWTGIIVGLYIIFHLMDLTWGQANSQFVRGDPYNNLVYSLQRPAVAIAYAVANIALGIHLYHGAWSMFQSMGINNPRINKLRRSFAIGFAALIAVGNLSFPIAVQAHWVELKCPHTEPATKACA
ncbi:MAG TPA: succinate dehydrogenase cytochrome b subunit [Acidimicrobiia bacterium]|nr:succinate dehydrogenase cytochrome b subunit [Acidimicrobiia bacterium]